MFRRERPQKGRYRQFFQIGAEAIGSESPLVDGEVIELVTEILKRSGLEGFTLILIARDIAKAEALASEFDAGHVHAATLAAFAEFLEFDWRETEGRLDLVINATSLGMRPGDPLPVAVSRLAPGTLVCDIVTRPAQTRLLREAAARAASRTPGCPCWPARWT